MTVKNEEDNMADDKKAQPKVIWDDSKLVTSYANVCNVSSTREEFNLLFGTNQNWNTAQKDVTIELRHRIVLHPHAAKRLALLLTTTVEKYEAQVGTLDLGDTGPTIQ